MKKKTFEITTAVTLKNKYFAYTNSFDMKDIKKLNINRVFIPI